MGARCVSLAVADTGPIIRELEERAAYDDAHGCAAQRVLEHRAQFTVHDVESEQFQSSRIDRGEARCVALDHQLSSGFS